MTFLLGGSFERWNDPSGNPLVSINRDGSVTSEGVSGAGNTIAFGPTGVKITDTYGNVFSMQSNGFDLTPAGVPAPVIFGSSTVSVLGDQIGNSMILGGTQNFNLTNPLQTAGIVCELLSTKLKVKGTPIEMQGPINLTVPAGTAPAGVVSLGSTTATTVGGAGGASALPATPLGYLIGNVSGVAVKIPYYPAS